MLTAYDPNVAQRAVHTVRVTFMQWKYSGHIAFEIGGNCCGAELLESGLSFSDTDNSDDIARYIENDCRLSFHEDDEFYSMELYDSEGNELLWDGSSEELKDTIVSVEISAVRGNDGK